MSASFVNGIIVGTPLSINSSLFFHTTVAAAVQPNVSTKFVRRDGDNN